MRRVLVVEDEPIIRTMIVDALEEEGYVVIEAATADDAMTIIGKFNINLLLTDIRMPGKLSGVDLAHAVAQRFPDAGIVIACGRFNLTELVLPKGAEIFPKPFDLRAIIARLDAMADFAEKNAAVFLSRMRR